MKSGTPLPSASSLTLSSMHEHSSRTNWSMFVFKLHTFDKRLLKVEAASFFCQRAKWMMLSLNSSFYYTLWVWLSQCCWSWQLLCQHFHNGVNYFLKLSSLVFIIYAISCTAQGCLFTSFLSGGFITAIVVNPPERKLAKRTIMHDNRKPPSLVIKPHSEYTRQKVSVMECF